jgi:DNA repair photolyase
MHEVYAKGILSSNNGMNIYRGCTHGCIYCDSRSHCYQFTHPFEDIEVKINAPELLEKALRSKRKKCMIATGSMCDVYIPLEKEIQLTRKCLEIIDRYGFGVAIQTKSDLIIRDLDVLKRINTHSKVVVQITLTTIDDTLCQLIEPHVALTSRRIDVLHRMKEAGIPTVVWLDPILPFINDTEANIRGILDACIEAKVVGIICFGMGLTLREGNREYFYKQLDTLFPKMKEKYIKKFGLTYQVLSDHHPKLMQIFHETCKKYGIMDDPNEIFAYMGTYPASYHQLTLL